MRPTRVLCPLAGLLVAAVAVSPLLAQLASPGGSSVSTVTPSRPAATTPPAATGGISTTSSRPAARSSLSTILPDPKLLDGSKLAPEKYPDYGMIGDFELPGDDITDPAQNQRVGASNSNRTEPAAGGNAKLDPIQKSAGGGSSQDKSAQAGGSGGDGAPQDGASGGGSQAKADKAGGNTAGTKAGGRSPGRNDPNAKAEGIQVGELVIDDSVAKAPQIDATGAPTEIGLGDSAMAIKPVANAPAAATATQNAGNTQQSSKAAGPGGTQSGGGGSSGNRGTEKGKTMQSGL
jgi:hypothetical protein